MTSAPVATGEAGRGHVGLRRAFIVGCPRSGTTLLQAMLGRHPDVFTFPETHFFKKAWGRMWRFKQFGLAYPPAAAHAIAELRREVRLDGSGPVAPGFWPFFRTYGRWFTHIVDRACREAGKSVWIEKSPIHLHCLPDIVRAVPAARFVHVLRDGREVVASFYELCLRDPTRWLGQVLAGDKQVYLRMEPHDGRILRAVIARWNRDVQISLHRRGDPAHHLVRYDRLIADPVATLRPVCAFLGIEFDDGMLEYWTSAPEVLGWRAQFEHMQKVLRPLDPQHGAKYVQVLSAAQRAVVESGLLDGGDLDALLGEGAPA